MSAKIINYLACFTILFVSSIYAQDLNIQDVILKHTASIGTVEKRQTLKNMMLIGLSQFESKLPERKSVGKVAIVSNPSNLLFISNFASTSYPFEKIGNFEGKINVPFVTPGVRSPLGDFLFEHPAILKTGLFSGVMSLNWVMLEDNQKKGKLKFGGTKKIDNKKAYVVEYYGNGSSDAFKVRLFFDAETFQHIRSEYLEEFSGKTQTFGQLGRTSGYVLQLNESFSEFKTTDGITLPGIYKIHYMSSSNKGTYEYNWAFEVTDIKLNQPLDDGFFNF